MAIFKGIFLVSGILVYILVAFSIRLLFLIPSWRLRIISCWTKIICKYLRVILRIKVNIEGDRRRLGEKGNFVISNHLGYLDGVILGSLLPIVYTSKSEVKKWGLFGLMSKVGGTIFIDRKRKEKSPDYIQETDRILKSRINILSFPEGTSTNGDAPRTFQTVHFQAPLDAKCPVLPVAITYTGIDGEKASLKNRDKVCWYGQVKFQEHVLSLLKVGSIEAKVTLYPKIEPSSYSQYGNSRKNLSEAAHKIICNNYPLFR